MSDSPRVPVAVGDVIDGKYQVDRLLGAGGMGVVFVATHLQLEQKVAIKFLLPEVAKHPEAVARFSREARAAAKIQSEHVARVLDVATHASGAPYMVIEYLEGQDLEQTLQEHGALPVDKVVDYVLQALEALAEAHVAGIVHRDLKPANMFLARRADGSSVVKLLDFGISKLAGDKTGKLTHESAQMGSPLYMSPEQLNRSSEVDARADIWAIGVILQELVTGTAPFMADSLAEIVAGILSLPPLRMRLHDPEIPVGLEEVVLRCLHKVPDRRFPDVAQLAVALAPFAPERSAVSTERIVRVITGRKEISLPPASTSRAAATQAGLEASTRFVDPVAGAGGDTDRDGAAAPSPASPAKIASATGSAWQTTGGIASARRGRRLTVAVIAASATALAVLVGMFLRGSSGPAAPAHPATIVTPSAVAPPLDVPPEPEPIPQVSLSSLPSAPSASAAAPPRPARPSVVAPTVPATPAPTAKPAVPDFGGRK